MRISRSLFVVALAATLAVVPAGGARADRPFTFYGAGWGHGVGLSQWGAYGLARQGWGARRILGQAIRRKNTQNKHRKNRALKHVQFHS